MKMLLAGFMVYIISSCAKTGSNIIALEGNYIGCFHRTHDKASQVSINFSDHNYTGQSSEKLYPALSKGAFKQKETFIIFNDSCYSPSNLEQVPVLQGTYNYEYYDDGTVRIWRPYGNGVDEYILKKLREDRATSYRPQAASLVKNQ
jgi:hypothetical protein